MAVFYNLANDTIAYDVARDRVLYRDMLSLSCLVIVRSHRRRVTAFKWGHHRRPHCHGDLSAITFHTVMALYIVHIQQNFLILLCLIVCIAYIEE